MEITEVFIKLANDNQERLKAFGYIVIDHSFVIRDLKIVQGPRQLFVAMPSRKKTARCPRCQRRNELRARFCNECGVRLPKVDEGWDRDRGGSSFFSDIVHPINAECRAMIESRVLQTYFEELDRLKHSPSAYNKPNPYFDDDEDYFRSE